MNLWLDDIRIPPSHYHDSGEWRIAKSYNEAVFAVFKYGFPQEVSLDHDLGGGSDVKTGYDFAKWLIEYDHETGKMPKDFRYHCHSANPVGRKNILELLEAYINAKG